MLPGGAIVLAGDLHWRVTPPDDPTDVTRGLERTIELARREKLDFVVFTPHVGARFYLDGSSTATSARPARTSTPCWRTSLKYLWCPEETVPCPAKDGGK